MKRLSVIIPVYKVENQIEKCATSLFKQTLPGIEYIFVNDCSPDNSMQKLNEVIEQFPEKKKDIIIVQHETNKGLSKARLSGLLKATGEYVAHCDSDDWVEPNMYELMINAAEKETADVVCSGFFYDDGENTEEQNFSKSYFNKTDYLNKIAIGGIYSSLCNKIVKKSLYTDNNVHPIEGVSLWEDMVVTIRLIYHSNSTVLIQRPLYHYVFKKDSISSSSTFSTNHIKDQIKVAKIINDFFLYNVKEYSKYKLQIEQIKFISKLQLLTNLNTQNIVLWKKIFPESNNRLIKYKELSLKAKLISIFALIFPVPVTEMVIKAIYKLKNS